MTSVISSAWASLFCWPLLFNRDYLTRSMSAFDLAACCRLASSFNICTIARAAGPIPRFLKRVPGMANKEASWSS
jgi:hypothetical protein